MKSFRVQTLEEKMEKKFSTKLLDSLVNSDDLSFYVSNHDTDNKKLSLSLNLESIEQSTQTNGSIGRIFIAFADINITKVKYPYWLQYDHDDSGNVITTADTCYPQPRSNVKAIFSTNTLEFSIGSLPTFPRHASTPKEVVFEITYDSSVPISQINLLDTTEIRDSAGKEYGLIKSVVYPTFAIRNLNTTDQTLELVVFSTGIVPTDLTDNTLREFHLKLENITLLDVYNPEFLHYRSGVTYNNLPVPRPNVSYNFTSDMIHFKVESNVLLSDSPDELVFLLHYDDDIVVQDFDIASESFIKDSTGNPYSINLAEVINACDATPTPPPTPPPTAAPPPTFELQNIDNTNKTADLVMHVDSLTPTKLTNGTLSKISVNFTDIVLTHVDFPTYLFYNHDENGDIETYEDDDCYPIPRSNIITEFTSNSLTFETTSEINLVSVPDRLVFKLKFSNDATSAAVSSAEVRDKDNNEYILRDQNPSPPPPTPPPPTAAPADTFTFLENDATAKTVKLVIDTTTISAGASTDGTIGAIQLNLGNINMSQVTFPPWLLYEYDSYGNVVRDGSFPKARANVVSSFGDQAIAYAIASDLLLADAPDRLEFSITYTGTLDMSTVEVLVSSFINDGNNKSYTIKRHDPAPADTFTFSENDATAKTVKLVIDTTTISAGASTDGTIGAIQLNLGNINMSQVTFPPWLLYEYDSYGNVVRDGSFPKARANVVSSFGDQAIAYAIASDLLLADAPDRLEFSITYTGTLDMSTVEVLVSSFINDGNNKSYTTS